ncbi:putative quinol monooxygenase [Actinocorallia populi]|uniref:putative quinol monooxygenase n=1 Tax=Actinocorallia populi TaxID=2079200 RepID=UPI000D08EAEE|nr:putative quinol monooxygenase [Actinocorallia populi]
MPYAVIARYRVAPHDAGLVRRTLLEMRERTLEEPANLAYIVHVDPAEENVFTLYEQYTDQAGFEAHKQTPHFTEHVLGTIFPKLTDRTVTFLDVL